MIPREKTIICEEFAGEWSRNSFCAALSKEYFMEVKKYYKL